MRVRTVCTVLVVGCALTAAARDTRWAAADPTLGSRIIETSRVTCAELLSLPSDSRDRVLIYFNGYVNGMRRNTTWNERSDGERIDRAMADCQANPGAAALDAFARAWGL
jgi:hypothetical protein